MSSHAPEATIVITTRDRPEMAERALASALNQSLEDLEVIIVDDASDPPFQLAHPDPRVSLIRLPLSLGVSGARNAGLARARGTWVTFLDDDDELLPQMLETSLKAAARSKLPGPIAVVSGIEILRSDGSLQAVRLPTSLPKGKDYFLEGAPQGRGFTVGNTLVVPLQIMTQIGGFDEQLRSAVHSELFLRVNAVCSIEGVPSVTYRVRRHGGAQIHANALERARAMERTERKHHARFVRHRRRHAKYLASMGLWYLKAGRWGASVRAATRATRIDPLGGTVLRSWLLCLAGPGAVSLYRWLIRRVRSEPRRISHPSASPSSASSGFRRPT